jgi:hypothetical protein
MLLNLGSPGIPLRLAGSQITIAGQSNFYYWAPGAPQLTAGNQLNQWIPSDLILLPGATIGPVTAGLLAGDQWGTPVMWVEELIQIGTGGIFEDREPALHRGEWWISAPASAVGLVAELRGPAAPIVITPPAVPMPAERLPGPESPMREGRDRDVNSPGPGRQFDL